VADTGHIDDGEALHAQSAQQHVEGLVRRDLTLRDEGQLALDPRIGKELLAGGAGQGTQHCLQVGFDEIEPDGLVAQGRNPVSASGTAAPIHARSDRGGRRPLSGIRSWRYLLAARTLYRSAPGCDERLADLTDYRPHPLLTRTATATQQQCHGQGHQTLLKVSDVDIRMPHRDSLAVCAGSRRTFPETVATGSWV